MIDDLNEKIKLLQNEAQKIKQNISLLSDNLKHARNSQHIVNGQLQGLTYVIEEMKKKEADCVETDNEVQE